MVLQWRGFHGKSATSLRQLCKGQQNVGSTRQDHGEVFDGIGYAAEEPWSMARLAMKKNAPALSLESLGCSQSR